MIENFIKRSNRMLWWANYRWSVPLAILLTFWTMHEVGRWIKIGWMYVWTTEPFGGGGGGGF